MIIKCFYTVYNRLGYGFLERVYENALAIELKKAGFNCLQQAPVNVYYENTIVGNYFADIIVDNKIILELKVSDAEIMKEHELQLYNYLKATTLELGLILNFGKKPVFKRKIFTKKTSA
ncbi:MAG: GxxExxY protein [Ferruginibacter sp.]